MFSTYSMLPFWKKKKKQRDYNWMDCDLTVSSGSSYLGKKPQTNLAVGPRYSVQKCVTDTDIVFLIWHLLLGV